MLLNSLYQIHIVWKICTFCHFADEVDDLTLMILRNDDGVQSLLTLSLVFLKATASTLFGLLLIDLPSEFI